MDHVPGTAPLETGYDALEQGEAVLMGGFLGGERGAEGAVERADILHPM